MRLFYDMHGSDAPHPHALMLTASAVLWMQADVSIRHEVLPATKGKKSGLALLTLERRHDYMRALMDSQHSAVSQTAIFHEVCTSASESQRQAAGLVL